MIKKALSLTCLTILISTGLYADFSYQQTSKITGGMMAGVAKLAGAFSRNASEAGNVTVLVKGDRMAHLNPNTGTIIDLGSETITEINFRNKTYSVVTFAQMAQMLDQMSKKMQAQQGGKADVNFKASVKETGQSRQISGLTTRQVIMTMEMQGTDKESGNKGAMVVTSDMWLAKDVPGYGEVKAFYQRMAQKLAWTPGASALTQGRADMAKAFADLQKEGSKLDGVPVLQIVSMTVAGEGQPGQSGQPSQPPPAARKEESPTPSIGGALGRLGGLGGLGRRKKEEPKQQEQQEPPASAPTGTSSGAPGSLMETTMESSAFSTAPIDAAKVQVPAGFRQVESEMAKGLK